MKVHVLGCGGSTGVPTLLGGWGRCDPNEPRNERRRSSILLEFNGYTLLVDSGPDIRLQLLDADWKRIDGVLYTHTHADHIMGIDELRLIPMAQQSGPLPVYSTADVLETIDTSFIHVFRGFGMYDPFMVAKPLDEDKGFFELAGQRIDFFRQPHGRIESLGLRLGKFAYCTDCVDLDESHFQRLEGLDIFMVDAVRHKPHPAHAHLEMVLEWVERLKPKQTYLTHMSNQMDYGELCAMLPGHIRPAHDGMILEL